MNNEWIVNIYTGNSINSNGNIVAAGDPKIHKQLLKLIQKVK